MWRGWAKAHDDSFLLTGSARLRGEAKVGAGATSTLRRNVRRCGAHDADEDDSRRMRLEVRELSLAYGDVVALRNLSAEVNGRVIGVLGATASGKTSLLQIIAGQIAPTRGEVRIDATFAEGDMRGRFLVLRVLDRLLELGVVVVLREHPGDAAAICDEVLILHGGQAVEWGSPSDITARAAGQVFEGSIPLGSLPA